MNRNDYPPIITQAHWLTQRTALLAKEKAFTRLHDRYNAADEAHDCCAAAEHA